ncbi:unnamed protein product [Staurois parvus]|uniref:Uncharacterized protein n=1 Tax=Staurois parvus TaxID=386267 RepID=A0ABN9DSM2_9NEOB|nr:unnamed protein product [Staurois parvus]
MVTPQTGPCKWCWHTNPCAVKDWGPTTGDCQRLWTYYRRRSETVDKLQEMVRDCKHTSGDSQKLQTNYSRPSETADNVQEIVRN